VVIRDLYVVSVAIPPHEADAELVVDGNTVLAIPVMLQLFQSIAGRNSQILHSGGCVEHGQFLPGGFPQIRWGHSLAFPRVPELLRAFVREGLNHEESLINVVNNVKH
jgi:hypothetical protein